MLLLFSACSGGQTAQDVAALRDGGAADVRADSDGAAEGGAALGDANAGEDGHTAAPTPEASVPGDAHVPLLDGNVFDAAPAAEHSVVERWARLEDDWPLLRIGTSLRSFSSFDRAGGNRDGFAGEYSALRIADDGTFVIFDAEGPGLLTTLWFTGPREGGTGLDLGTVRFYFDGEDTPRIELAWQDLFSGDRAPFLEPLVADRSVSTGGYVSWVPVPYAKHLTITTERRGYFYGAYYETFPPDMDLESFAEPFSVGTLVSRWSEATDGAFSEDVTAVGDDYTHVGAGTLETLQIDLGHEPTWDELRQAQIQIWWDGLAAPSVNAPLGPFFGAALPGADVRALAFTARGGKFESRFPMPFWEGFRLRVVGVSATVGVRVGAPRFAREASGYFFATWAEERPTSPGEDFRWTIPESTGRLAGTILTVEPVDPLVKKWWEGDLRSYIDGSRSPNLHGTGHEDDHFGGWSNTFLTGPFSLPMHGEPSSEIIDLAGQYNANTTMYRLYVGHDFLGGLSHGTEHGTQNTVSANYSGVAFYYAQPDRRLADVDRLMLADDPSRAAHGYAALGETGPVSVASAFEGREYQEVVDVAVTYHTGSASFVLAVDPGSRGCLLRRSYDQQQGPQAARIFVDAQPVGTWYTAETNGTLRLAERDYFLPEAALAGKSSIAITVEPVAGFASWSAAEYRTLCVL